MLGRLIVGKVVQQNRAQNRALRFYVRGKSADAVIGGCHVRRTLWRNLPPRISEDKANRQMNCEQPVKPGDILWKPRENATNTFIGNPKLAKAAHLPSSGDRYPCESYRSLYFSLCNKNKCGRASHPTASFVDLSHLPSRR